MGRFGAAGGAAAKSSRRIAQRWAILRLPEGRGGDVSLVLVLLLAAVKQISIFMSARTYIVIYKLYLLRKHDTIYAKPHVNLAKPHNTVPYSSRCRAIAKSAQFTPDRLPQPLCHLKPQPTFMRSDRPVLLIHR